MIMKLYELNPALSSAFASRGLFVHLPTPPPTLISDRL